MRSIIGQPIKLHLLSGRGGPSRNPFDSAVMPGRPLSERITAPGGRARSYSPPGRYTQDEAARKGIDRYIPGQGGSRSRSPAPRHRGGRRPGARREGDGGRRGGGGGGGGNGGGRRDQESGQGGRGGNPRGKKTQEELDAEMEDYFGGGEAAPAAANGTSAPVAATETQAVGTAAHGVDDIDMIE